MAKTNLRVVEKKNVVENEELAAALEVMKGLKESGELSEHYYRYLGLDDISTAEKIISFVYDAQRKLSLVLAAFHQEEDQMDINSYEFEAVRREIKEIWCLLNGAGELHAKTH